MRVFAPLAFIFSGLFWLCASDSSDRKPAWDALLLTSYNRGDATDATSYVRTPTVSAGATFPAGYQVADFDGSTSATITYPDDAAFESAPFSVIFWARIDSSTSRINLIGKNTTTASPETYRGWYIHFVGTSAGSQGIAFVCGTNGVNWRGKNISGTSGYGDAVWRHYAVICDSISDFTNWKIYINGVDQSLSIWGNQGTVSTVANGEPFTIGGLTTLNQTARFNGALDDVRIYNTVKTAAEIGAIYAEGLGASRP